MIETMFVLDESDKCFFFLALFNIRVTFFFFFLLLYEGVYNLVL